MKKLSLPPIAEVYTRAPFKACQRAIKETAHVPPRERLDAINKLLELHGTEAIRGSWQNGFWGDTVAVYCNTGDTYDATVIEVRGESQHHRSRLIISSWGDWVERNQKKYDIQ